MKRMLMAMIPALLAVMPAYAAVFRYSVFGTTDSASGVFATVVPKGTPFTIDYVLDTNRGRSFESTLFPYGRTGFPSYDGTENPLYATFTVGDVISTFGATASGFAGLNFAFGEDGFANDNPNYYFYSQAGDDTLEVGLVNGNDLRRFYRTDPDGADSFIILDIDTTTIAAAVPEPATWAMMIAGFGLVGGTMRRSRQRGASVPVPA